MSHMPMTQVNNPQVVQQQQQAMMPPNAPYHKPMQPPPQQPGGDLNAQFNNMSLDNNKPMQTHAGILDSGPQSNNFYNRRYNQSFNSPRMDYGGGGGGGGGYRGGYNNGYSSGGPRDNHPNDWGRPSAADADLEK